MGPKLLFILGIVLAHGALAAGWMAQRASAAARFDRHLRAYAGFAQRLAALLAAARIAGAGRHPDHRSADETAVNAATLTMDGLTTPENDARFARSARTRRVAAVSDDEDAQLMLAYARGEMRAFETLYSRHRGALYRYLMRQARDGEIANDLFQEVWSRVIVNRARYEPRAKFRTFLFTLAHNCFIDHCRRTKARASRHGHRRRGRGGPAARGRGIAARRGAGARRSVAPLSRGARQPAGRAARRLSTARGVGFVARGHRAGSPESAPRRRRAGCATR